MKPNAIQRIGRLWIVLAVVVLPWGLRAGIPAYVSIGLSIQKSFGKETAHPLKGWYIGPEVSFFPVTFLGMEAGIQYGFSRKELITYAEAGTGVGVAGIQFGPWISHSFKDQSRRLGTQVSMWGGFVYGFGDLRVRMYLDGASRSLQTEGPIIGLTGKLPLYHTLEYDFLP